MPKLISEGICMCFYKAIIQSMFKHVASGNGSLVSILQSYFQIFNVKHIDWSLAELIWTTKNCRISSVSVSLDKLYELRNFTNTNRRNCPKRSFFNSTNRQTRVKNIFRKVAFLLNTVGQKSKYGCHPPFHPPPHFLSPFFTNFVSHPPKINELDTVVTITPVLRPWHPLKIWNMHKVPLRFVFGLLFSLLSTAYSQFQSSY